MMKRLRRPREERGAESPPRRLRARLVPHHRTRGADPKVVRIFGGLRIGEKGHLRDERRAGNPPRDGATLRERLHARRHRRALSPNPGCFEFGAGRLVCLVLLVRISFVRDSVRGFANAGEEEVDGEPVPILDVVGDVDEDGEDAADRAAAPRAPPAAASPPHRPEGGVEVRPRTARRDLRAGERAVPGGEVQERPDDDARGRARRGRVEEVAGVGFDFDRDAVGFAPRSRVLVSRRDQARASRRLGRDEAVEVVLDGDADGDPGRDPSKRERRRKKPRVERERERRRRRRRGGRDVGGAFGDGRREDLGDAPLRLRVATPRARLAVAEAERPTRREPKRGGFFVCFFFLSSRAFLKNASDARVAAETTRARRPGVDPSPPPVAESSVVTRNASVCMRARACAFASEPSRGGAPGRPP